MVIADNVFITV